MSQKKKSKQYQNLISKQKWIIIFFVGVFLISLFCLLFFLLDKKIVSFIYFVIFVILAIPILYLTFKWRFFKGAVSKQFIKNSNFIVESSHYRKMIDDIYTNVIYDLDALYGAYLRKIFPIAIIFSILSFSSLIMSIIAAVL